jgi:hypothetical protein
MDQIGPRDPPAWVAVSCGNAFVTSDDAGLAIRAPRDRRAFVHGKRMTTL